MEITLRLLKKWKKNSIKTARKQGYDPKILDFLDEKTELHINEKEIPKGLWYGYTVYGEKPIIVVFSKNLSCKPVTAIYKELIENGVPKKEATRFTDIIRLTPKGVFFEIFNQSGMDHELIGHQYNYLAGKESDEPAAISTQLELAKARSGLLTPQKIAWKLVSLLAGVIIKTYRKKDFTEIMKELE